MRNEFLPYEDDFEQWVEGGFAPAEPETQAYLRFLADPDDERRPRPGGLWEHHRPGAAFSSRSKSQW